MRQVIASAKIHADNEFRPLFETVADDLDVIMNYTNAGDHVPEAERNNRVLQERLRTAYHRLPCKASDVRSAYSFLENTIVALCFRYVVTSVSVIHNYI